jgi:hypothetical protein
MFVNRLLSLVLCASLVACPSVCRTRACAADTAKVPELGGCPHCRIEDGPPEQSSDSRRDSDEPQDSDPATPPAPCCEFGNCLCAGALLDHSGVELQLEHMLALFVAIADEGDELAAFAPTHFRHFEPVCCGDAHLAGRLLRLRIESLLI